MSRYFAAGPWENDYRATPFSLHSFFRGWDESVVVNLVPVLKAVQSWGFWKREAGEHSLVTIIPPSISRGLAESVLVSWLARGIRNWRIATQGNLAVKLPMLTESD